MSKLKYPVTIRPLTKEEGDGFLAAFPNLPGCIADGDTVEEALYQAEDALEAWLAAGKEFGDEIPDLPLPQILVVNGVSVYRKACMLRLHYEQNMRGVSLNTLAAMILAQSMGQKICKR